MGNILRFEVRKYDMLRKESFVKKIQEERQKKEYKDEISVF